MRKSKRKVASGTLWCAPVSKSSFEQALLLCLDVKVLHVGAWKGEWKFALLLELESHLSYIPKYTGRLLLRLHPCPYI